MSTPKLCDYEYGFQSTKVRSKYSSLHNCGLQDSRLVAKGLNSAVVNPFQVGVLSSHISSEFMDVISQMLLKSQVPVITKHSTNDNLCIQRIVPDKHSKSFKKK